MILSRKKAYLIFLILLISSMAFGQYQARTLKCKEDPDLSFPVFIGSNKEAAEKINKFLQMDFFETTMYKIQEARLFDESRFIAEDSISQSGYTSISYNIELNDTKILSLIFEVEFMGAYPTYFKKYFSFNANTGNMLTADSVFTKEGIKTIQKLLIDRRKKKIKIWIDELRNDAAGLFKEDSSFIFETFDECNKIANETNVFIGKEKVLFYKGDCFPHASMPLNTDLNIGFTRKQLEKYLSPFGKTILFTN